MNHYQRGTGSHGNAHTCYLSPRGHYYVAQGELDTRYARHAELINRYQPSPASRNPSQFELARRSGQN